MKRIVALGSVLAAAAVAVSCSSGGAGVGDPDDTFADEAFGQSTEFITKCQNPTPATPQGNFCDDPACPCTLGEGDCDLNAQCVAPYACTGSSLKFGATVNYNVCAGSHCANKAKDGDETSVDCGGSCGSVGCPADSCAGLPPNGSTGHCSATCPCPSGNGSCASNSCQSGLQCTVGAGPQWGFSASVNVCELPTCRNGVQDGTETATDCGGSCAPCGGAAQISFRKGGAAADSAAAIALDASGNIIIVGKFSGTINLGGSNLVSAGSSDIFVAKYNSAGVHQWSKRFGGTGADGDSSVNVATDNNGSIYLVGNIYGAVDFGGGPRESVGATSSAFIAKFTAAGAHVWSGAYGGPQGNRMKSIAVTNAGVIYVAGAFQDSINLGGSTFTSHAPGTTLQDIFVARLTTNGVHVWSKYFGSATDDQAVAIAIDADGDAYVAGHFSGTVSFAGTSLSSTGNNDGFGLKLAAATGNTLWAVKLGGTGEDRALSVAVGSNKHPVFTGYFRGTADFGGGAVTGPGSTDAFVVSRDTATGAYRWAKTFGGTGADFAVSARALAATNEVAVTGYFRTAIDPGGGVLTSAGNDDVYIARYSASGGLAWQGRYGGTSADQATSIATSSSRIAITGNFAGTANFGGGNLTSAGSNDIFVATYSF